MTACMTENLQAVVDAVNSILQDASREPMAEAVAKRLASLGYEPAVTDAWVIVYCMQKSVNHILNETNQTAVPDGLFEVAVDMICGELLNMKYLSGQLNVAGLDLSGAVQSVSEGDTSVTFAADASDDAKIRALLEWMMQGKGCDLLCYRKMRW